MSLPENWDQRLAELTRGCSEEEKGEIYQRLMLSFAWKCMLDLKQRGKLTPEATARFMRGMDEQDAQRRKENLELVQKLSDFKNNVLEMGQTVDAWAEEVMKEGGLA